jgi:hypothetical protein
MLMLAALIALQSAGPDNANAPPSEISLIGKAVPADILRPLPEDKLKSVIPGNISDESPYPADAGPLVFFKNGTVAKYGGWGNPSGKYEIRDNKAIIRM